MYRAHNTQYGGFSQVQDRQRYTSSGAFGVQRTPLYPIGPTLTQPQFRPINRGVSPSPYLNRQGIKPPSYQDWHLRKAESNLSRNNINYEERQKRMIQRNEREIQEQKRRRQQIRTSYQRQINALNHKQNKNVQKKQKLLTQIQTLQSTHDQLHTKLMSQAPPQTKLDTYEPIDRKQQQMIVLKNKLVTNMRQNQIELNKKRQEQEKYWQDQIGQKQKVLFRLQQNLRQKRLQLHTQKQKALQKPDFLMIQEQVRMTQYDDFLYKYEELEQQIKRLVDQRQLSAKEVNDSIFDQKTKFKDQSAKRTDIRKQLTNARLRVEQLERVSAQMEAANENLIKQLGRKQQMIEKYQLDIHQLKQKKTATQSQITKLISEARQHSHKADAFDQLSQLITKCQEDLKFEQANNSKLKNQYQRLYQLLCSATSKNIHQTFNETLAA